MSKVRIYDLAKELKLDNKKVIEEVRRFGYDVSVPSNSVPPDIAEKVKSKYFPQKTQAERRVKLVKHRADEPELGVATETAAEPQMAKSKPAETVKPSIDRREEPRVAESRPAESRPAEMRPADTRAPMAVKVVKKTEQPPAPVTTAAPAPPQPARETVAPPRETVVAEEAKPRIVRIEPPRPEPTPNMPNAPSAASPSPSPAQSEPRVAASAETKAEPRVTTPPAAPPATGGIKTHIIPLQPPVGQMPSASTGAGPARREEMPRHHHAPPQHQPAQGQRPHQHDATH